MTDNAYEDKPLTDAETKRLHELAEQFHLQGELIRLCAENGTLKQEYTPDGGIRLTGRLSIPIKEGECWVQTGSVDDEEEMP